MAGVCPYANRPDKVRTPVTGLLNIFRHDPLASLGDPPADSLTKFEPFNGFGHLVRQTRGCVETQPMQFLNNKIIDEDMTIHVLHDIAAERFHYLLGLLALKQLACRLREYLRPVGSDEKRFLTMLARAYIAIAASHPHELAFFRKNRPAHMRHPALAPVRTNESPLSIASHPLVFHLIQVFFKRLAVIGMNQAAPQLRVVRELLMAVSGYLQAGWRTV